MSQAALHGYLSPEVTDRFFNLDQGSKIMAEYVWIGGTGQDLRSKTRTLEQAVKDVSELPEWNYDGSSTEQAEGHFSEIIIKPRAIFKDPFRGGDNIIVMCDAYSPDGSPHPTNTRAPADEIFEQAKEHEPWFGIEQEWTLFSADKYPFGWPKGGFPGPQGPYYCGAGTANALGRPVVEAHYKACLYAGVKIAGCNAEVMAGQWEYQVGPCLGISIGDHLWISRYLLHRISEYYNVIVSFEPKPIQGDWNGAGCHTNYSTKAMREDGGFKVIIDAIEKLSKVHAEHIAVYGANNDQRLTGKHETATIDKFSYGVGNRGASVRIPVQTEKDGKGYFEDRRPAANIDPYVVGSKLVHTTCL